MRSRRIAVPVAALMLTGCATVANPGRTRSVPAVNSTEGSTIKVSRLRLRHTGPELMVFEGNRQLAIHDEADYDDHITMCRAFEQGERLSADMEMVTVSRTCMNSILFPYVELPKSGTHSLRLVRPGQETTVTVKAGTHWQWFWFDGFCMVLAPACWGVDIAGGSWSYFGSLDVADAMQRPSRTAAVSHD